LVFVKVCIYVFLLGKMGGEGREESKYPVTS
jgi:hypothetical protein